MRQLHLEILRLTFSAVVLFWAFLNLHFSVPKCTQTSLKILPYHKIIYKAQLPFFHSIHYNYAPSTFINSWKINSDRDTQHELRNANDYQIPPAKLTFFTRFPLHTLPKTWNSAGIITCYSNPTTFKIALNDELLNGNKFNRVQLPLPTPHPTSPLTTDPQSPYKFKYPNSQSIIPH